MVATGGDSISRSTTKVTGGAGIQTSELFRGRHLGNSVILVAEHAVTAPERSPSAILLEANMV